MVLTWIILFASNHAFAVATTEASVTFIRLGDKGNATLVITHSGGTAKFGLVDTGQIDDYRTYVAEHLRDMLQSSKLTFIALSHMHIDHMEGAEEAIAEFADENTTLYLKDVADPASTYSGEKLIADRSDLLIAAAKAKGMSIGKIRAYESFGGDVSSLSQLDTMSDNKFRAKIEKYVKNSQGNYVSTGLVNSVTFGNFTLTWFNGTTWNHQSAIETRAKSWDENVNSATLLLECTTITGNTFRTYLGADLGENSKDQYSYQIANQVQQVVGAVDVYQVAHHGRYRSIMPNSIAPTLNPKYAIVHDAYNDLVNFYCSKVPVTIPTDSQLSVATGTLKEVLKSTVLQKMYFTGGKGGGTDQRIINALAANNYALLNWNGSTIVTGNVLVEFGGADLTVTQ